MIWRCLATVLVAQFEHADIAESGENVAHKMMIRKRQTIREPLLRGQESKRYDVLSLPQHLCRSITKGPRSGTSLHVILASCSLT